MKKKKLFKKTISLILVFSMLIGLVNTGILTTTASASTTTYSLSWNIGKGSTVNTVGYQMYAGDTITFKLSFTGTFTFGVVENGVLWGWQRTNESE